MEIVKFRIPNVAVDLSFWEALYDLKLNKYGLIESEINIFAMKSSFDTEILVTKDSFSANDSPVQSGHLLNFNVMNVNLIV